METKKEFNEKEALELIEETINQAKNKINEDGFVFLLWGWIVFFGNIMNYIYIMIQKYHFIGYTWLILCIIGFIITMLYSRKKTKKIKHKIYVEKFLGYLWCGALIGFGILYVFMIINNLFIYINPVASIIFGIATFVTGGVIKFKPLVVGGILFWIFGIACFLITSEFQNIITASAMICGYIIPGYILKSQYKKQNHVQ